jgi:hypothetical protein
LKDAHECAGERKGKETFTGKHHRKYHMEEYRTILKIVSNIS